MKLKRWHWIAVVATIILVVMAPDEEKKSARPGKPSANVSSSSSDKQSSRAVGRVELELLAKLQKRQQERGKVSDVFNQTSWYVAPPAPVLTAKQKQEAEAPVAPPVQTAPPLPFTYLGRYGETDSRTVVLAMGEKVYTVKVGDVIDNTYRVEKFTPGAVNLTYLPLSIVQSLRTGEGL